MILTVTAWDYTPQEQLKKMWLKMQNSMSISYKSKVFQSRRRVVKSGIQSRSDLIFNLLRALNQAIINTASLECIIFIRWNIVHAVYMVFMLKKTP